MSEETNHSNGDKPAVPPKPLLTASTIDDLRGENKRLARMLLFYGDHCRPCNKWYNAEGPCTCGWEKLEKTLDAANTMVKPNSAKEQQ
jgi:hypothetical protein